MEEINNQDYMSDCVEDWRKQIRASASSADRKGFMKTARTCDEFFRGTVGGMWDDDFRSKFLDGIPAPRFKLTVAKGFELVAIMGPTIMWDYPGRTNRGIKHINLPREYFADGPNGDQQYQLYLEEAARLKALDKARSELMDAYQSYTPREQPGRDGLVGASRLAITDAIVKGRGCLVVDTYQFPGSDRTLTGAFYMSVEDLFIDPGCRHADLTDCLWMARRRRDKYWKLEERFGLPKGSLKDKCTSISSESAASNDSMQATSERSQGKVDYNDTIVWYEIWSKCGVGMRGVRHRSKFVDKLDEVVGDYAYLAIADNVPYPLNYAPSVAKKSNNDEVAEVFEWPTPYYLDGRWPIALLDFYDVPNSAWPLAPMAMGLGELMFMNVVMSCLMERAYEACQSILAADESLSDDVMERLRQRDWSGVVECNVKGTNGGINDLIAFIKTPDLKSDVFDVLDAARESFNRRTG